MKLSESILYGRVLVRATVFLFLLVSVMSHAGMGMTLQGSIAASSVTVSGDVTVQNMTVSSLTASSLDVHSATFTIKGSILQTVYSSGTVNYTTSNSTLTAVTGTGASITLLNAKDYIRISLTGILASSIPSGSFRGDLVYLSVERDSADLGQGALASTYNLQPAGITIIDFPGDILPHTYSVTIGTGGGTSSATFTAGPQPFFFLQEVAQ